MLNPLREGTHFFCMSMAPDALWSYTPGSWWPLYWSLCSHLLSHQCSEESRLSRTAQEHIGPPHILLFHWASELRGLPLKWLEKNGAFSPFRSHRSMKLENFVSKWVSRVAMALWWRQKQEIEQRLSKHPSYFQVMPRKGPWLNHHFLSFLCPLSPCFTPCPTHLLFCSFLASLLDWELSCA